MLLSNIRLVTEYSSRRIQIICISYTDKSISLDSYVCCNLMYFSVFVLVYYIHQSQTISDVIHIDSFLRKFFHSASPPFMNVRISS